MVQWYTVDGDPALPKNRARQVEQYLKTNNRNVDDVLLDTTELVLLDTAEPEQPELELELEAAIDLGTTSNNEHVNVELEEATGDLKTNFEQVQVNGIMDDDAIVIDLSCSLDSDDDNDEMSDDDIEILLL
jgi:hypothetical protein